jgi:hypothetical protein
VRQAGAGAPTAQAALDIVRCPAILSMRLLSPLPCPHTMPHLAIFLLSQDVGDRRAAHCQGAARHGRRRAGAGARAGRVSCVRARLGGRRLRSLDLLMCAQAIAAGSGGPREHCAGPLHMCGAVAARKARLHAVLLPRRHPAAARLAGPGGPGKGRVGGALPFGRAAAHPLLLLLQPPLRLADLRLEVVDALAVVRG